MVDEMNGGMVGNMVELVVTKTSWMNAGEAVQRRRRKQKVGGPGRLTETT
jgi:hypothetical protein